MIVQLPELTAFQDIPGYKAILKAVIKSQIQFLVQQLSQQTGEESVLLTASISDGTLGHLGSEMGKVFLEKNDDFKSQFLGFCIKRHHSTLSRAAVRKKPPTAKRSVPFGYSNNPKRQHAEPFPVPGTVIETPVLNNDNNPTDIPDIAPVLPAQPTVETDNVEETMQDGSTEDKNAGENDDTASDKTIDNYPLVKQEPVDDSDNADASFQDLDTSITNGGEMIVKHKKGKKLKLPSDDQTYEGDPNASAVKIEYPGSEFMTDETGSSADTSLNMQDESGSFDYGQSPGSLTEHQLFFSQAEPTTKKKRGRGSTTPLACLVCGKIIKRGADMKKHLRIHTGLKPFVCDFCGKSFNQSSARSIHRRIHTGEKPYQCSRCSIRFRRKDALMVHQKLNQCSDSRNQVSESNIPQEDEDRLKIHQRSDSGSFAVLNIKQELEDNL